MPLSPSRPKDDRPFYWSNAAAVYFHGATTTQPSGWYQWTKTGLKYLGATILEPMKGTANAKP